MEEMKDLENTIINDEPATVAEPDSAQEARLTEKPGNAEKPEFEEIPESAESPEFTESSEPEEPMFKKAETKLYSPMDTPRKSNTPVIMVFVVLLLLLVVLGVYVILSLPKQLETGMGQIAEQIPEMETEAESETESDSSSFLDDFFNSDSWSDEEDNSSEDESWIIDPEIQEPAYEEQMEEESDDFAGIDWDANWKEQFENHSPEEFTGPYYENTVDCIDESVPYKVNREFFEYEDKESNVCIRVSYIQLEGDIPNLESINEKLKTNALWYATYFEENSDAILDQIQDAEIGFWVESFYYVTYNDEEQISIVLNEQFTYSYYTEPNLLATNINLKTGTVLDNTRILNLDDDFGAEFRERSIKQNGMSQGTEIFTDDEIVDMLRDEENLILFYTPVGLELGYSYSEDYYTGWITISMQDYEKYLAGM